MNRKAKKNKKSNRPAMQTPSKNTVEETKSRAEAVPSSDEKETRHPKSGKGV